MRKFIIKMSLALAAVFSLAVCKPELNPKDPEAITLESPVLASDASTVAISEYGDDVCLTYSWNDVAVEGVHPSYTIEFADGNDSQFSKSVVLSCVGLEKPLSSSLIKEIADVIGSDIKTGFTMLARVKVSAKNCKEVFSNTISVMVGEKQFTIEKLFIKGPAIESDPQAMTLSGTTFTWTGHLLKNADFKFPCQSGSDFPAIVRNTAAEQYWSAKVAFSEVDDFGFSVSRSGEYEIKIEAANSNAISIEAKLVKEDEKTVINELYVAGPAATSDWTVESMIPMELKDGLFVWEGELRAAEEFIFPTQNTALWPALMISADGSQLVYGSSESQKVSFTVATHGIYHIEIDAADIDALSYNLTLVKEIRDIQTIYPIGGFDWGWDQSRAECMTSEDGTVYTWTGQIWGGADFKFLCQNDGNWVPGYNRDANAEDYWTLVYRSSDGDPDVQFQVSETGIYTLVLNLETMKLKAIPAAERETIYLIGAAFDWGWDQSRAAQMETTDGVTYTWAGFMWGGGDFKFLCQNDGNWAPGYNRDADALEYWTLVRRESGDDPDVQFQVPENGDYKITINIQTMTISVEALPEFPKIYPIGCIEDWGWDLGKIQPMKTYDGITYTIVAQIWADNNFKFLCQNTDWWPGYTRDSESEDYFTVVYNDGSLPDTQFRLDTQGMESGVYKMTLNVQTGALTFEKQ